MLKRVRQGSKEEHHRPAAIGSAIASEGHMGGLFRLVFSNQLVNVTWLQVDILSKLPKTEFNQKVAATKWSEILEGLNIAIEMIGEVPKLTAGDYGDMVQKLKRLGDHSHVQVMAAVKLFGFVSPINRLPQSRSSFTLVLSQLSALNHDMWGWPTCVDMTLVFGNVLVK